MLCTLLLAVGLSSPFPVPENVLVVDRTQPGAYDSIQAGVDDALPGDIVLVRNGIYSGFTSTGKGISVVADPEAGGPILLSGGVIVDSVPLGETFVLTGFEIEAGGYNPGFPDNQVGAGVEVSDCQGSLRLQGLTLTGGLPPLSLFYNTPTGPGLFVRNSTDVVLVDGNLLGSTMPEYPFNGAGIFGTGGGHGLWVRNGSSVVVHRSMLRGGDGQDCPEVGNGGAGGAGVLVEFDSTVVFSQCLLEAGDAGYGNDFAPICNAPMPGAVAVYDSKVRSIGSFYYSGLSGENPNGCSPGYLGPDTSGDVVEWSAAPRAMLAETVVREDQTYPVQSFGQPGDFVWRSLGVAGQWKLQPAKSGVLLVDGTARIHYRILGTIAGGGMLATEDEYRLPPFLMGTTLHTQGFFRSTSGSIHLATPAAVVVLNALF